MQCVKYINTIDRNRRDGRRCAVGLLFDRKWCIKHNTKRSKREQMSTLDIKCSLILNVFLSDLKVTSKFACLKHILCASNDKKLTNYCEWLWWNRMVDLDAFLAPLVSLRSNWANWNIRYRLTPHMKRYSSAVLTGFGWSLHVLALIWVRSNLYVPRLTFILKRCQGFGFEKVTTVADSALFFGLCSRCLLTLVRHVFILPSPLCHVCHSLSVSPCFDVRERLVGSPLCSPHLHGSPLSSHLLHQSDLSPPAALETWPEVAGMRHTLCSVALSANFLDFLNFQFLSTRELSACVNHLSRPERVFLPHHGWERKPSFFSQVKES